MKDTTKFISRAAVCLMGAALFITVATGQQTPPAQMPTTAPSDADMARLKQLGSMGIHVHDPSSIIKCKDEYWIFYTGNGCPSWHSTDMVHWTAGPQAIHTAAPWIAQAVPANRGLNYWAPECIHAGDRYLMFYSVSSFGKNVSAIGVASNPTLDPTDSAYKWTDMGMVVQSTAKDDFNCIDPSTVRDADGNLWLGFGSFWSGIKMIQVDPNTGLRIAPDSPMYNIAHYRSIEASYFYYHDGYYYAFVNWGLCCRGVNSTYDIRIGRSKTVTGPYLDKDGKDMLFGGGSDFLNTDGPMIGPGQSSIYTENGKFWFDFHFYYNNGKARGDSALGIRPLIWGADGWPALELPDANAGK